MFLAVKQALCFVVMSQLPAAVHRRKCFFGAARNLGESASLTIMGMALVDRSSKMDDVILELAIR
jgi:transcription termination factor Rho